MKNPSIVRLFSAMIAVLSFMTVVSPASAAGLATGYPFNEGTGSTTVDVSGNANTATLVTPAWTSGKYGNGLLFNGTSDYVQVANSPSLDISGNKLTISMWVNITTSTAGDYVLLGKEWIDNSFSQPYYQYGLEFSKQQKRLDFYYGNSSGALQMFSSSNNVITYGVWQHVAMTYDGANVKFYVNGVLKGSTAHTGNLVARGTMLRIGADGLAGQNFKGKMDEIRVYNLAQTQAQIQADMNASLLPDTTAPTTPSAVSATSTLPTQATVSWTASTDNVAVAGYKVFRDGAQIATTTAVSYTNNGLLPATAYTYAVAAFDQAGNVSTSSAPVNVSTRPDTTLPVVSITAPANNATVSNLITITATSTDNVGVVGVQFKLDGVNLGAEDAVAPYSISWDTASTTNGAHVLTAVSRDAAGNVKTSSNINVTVSNTGPDVTPPSASITAPANNATVSNSVAVSATASDNVGVVGVQFKLDGVNLGVEDTTSPYSISWNTLTASNGAHALTAVARDAAGNTTTTASVAVTVFNDTTPPTIAVTVPADGITVSGQASVTASAADNVGVVGVQFKLDGANLGAEDTSAPYGINWNTLVASNGTHTLSATARDAAGNVGTATVITVTVFNDTTPPSVSLTNPTNGATIAGTQTLSATASDNVGVASVKYYIDGSLLATLVAGPFDTAWDTTAVTDGSHTVLAVAADTSNNQASSTINVTVQNTPSDIIAPSVPSGLSTSNTTQTATTISWVASTDNVAVAGYKLFRNGTQIATTTLLSFSDAGLTASTTYAYAVAAFDAAGNVSASSLSVDVTTLPYAASIYPLTTSTDGRYLVDQNGNPTPILGRTAWFIASLNTADMHTFIDDTAARGYNAIEFNTMNHDSRGNNEPFDGYGNVPFLKTLGGANWSGSLNYGNITDVPDFTTPNEAYWSNVDQLIAYAQSKGIMVFMFPAYVGYPNSDQGWMGEVLANGPAKIQTYSAWIANRYKNQPNIIWMLGGDQGTFNAEEQAVEQGLLDGLKSVPGQLSRHFSAEWSSNMFGTSQSTFGSALTLNSVYSWDGFVANQGRSAYASGAGIPSFLLEEPYDEEGSDGTGVNSSAIQPVRRFQWWGWLSTIGGYVSGNGYIWSFNPGWMAHLDVQGSRDMAKLNAFIRSINWWKLVPSGLNGMKNLIVSDGSQPVFPDYIAASATPDGTLMVAYVPPAHNGSFTVDMTAMSGTTTARWFDPTSGAYTTLSTSLPNTGTHVFAIPGLNSVGDQDWVLVLTAQTGPILPNGYYTTNFSAAENPISEGGVWLNGGTDGVDWIDVRTQPGLAYGNNQLIDFNDPTAVLKGTWGPDQTAIGTVHTVNPNGSIYEEVELRLRSTIAANSSTGYEVLFSARPAPSWYPYVQIVRWNGAIGSFTYLADTVGPGLQDGDVIKATVVGNVITAYQNGVQILQAVDNTYTNGSPGIGFYGENGSNNTDYGFTSFTAYDTPSGDTTTPSVPSGLSAVATSASQINLSWTASTDNVGVTGYRIYRDGVQVGVSASTSYSDTGLTASTLYTYTVSAYDAAANTSAQSSSANATTLIQTGPTWSYVQTGARNSSASTNVLGFSANNTAGNLIVVEVDWEAGSNFSSITDTQGNSYTQIGTEQTSFGLKSRLYYAKDIKAGPNTVTTIVTGSPAFHEIYIHEYSGVSTTNPLDTFSVNSASGGTFSSGNVVTASDNELLYGAEIDSAFASAAAGWSMRSNMNGNVIADKNASTVGSYAYTGSSSGSFVAWIVAFK
jgi:chitodextrinase